MFYIIVIASNLETVFESSNKICMSIYVSRKVVNIMETETYGLPLHHDISV
jgi:hypothetical protein